MPNLSMEQNVSFQQTIHKERVKKVKGLISEYKQLNRKTETVTNMIADTVIKMESYSTLAKIHIQLGGEKAVSYKTLWRWVDTRKKAKAISNLVGKKPKANLTAKQIEVNVIGQIKKGMTDKQIKSLYKEERKRVSAQNKMSPEDRHIVELVEQTRKLDFVVNHSYILKALDQEGLSNLHENIKQIYDGLNKHFGTKSVKKKKVQRKKVSKRSVSKKVANGLTLMH